MSVPAITVVGGGLGGLVAAITAAERGASVQLHEAHHSLGGRWRATEPPYVLHEGPHVIYADGPILPWLAERSLLREKVKVPYGALTRFYFRSGGRLRHVPPLTLARVLARRIRSAPADQSYRAWATSRFGEAGAEVSARASGVGVFHPDPGELSAEFVWERLRRVFGVPPAASYRPGAWGHMFEALGTYARTLGVQIELGSRVTEMPGGLTIVASELESARVLLGDDSLRWPSGRTSLLDLGLVHDRRDAFVVSDLDAAGWLETFSVPDPSLAPPGSRWCRSRSRSALATARPTVWRRWRAWPTWPCLAGGPVSDTGARRWPTAGPGRSTIPARPGGTGRQSNEGAVSSWSGTRWPHPAY
jgi:hypothetical protein